MKKRLFLPLSLLPLAFLVIACVRQEPAGPTAAATISAAATPPSQATVFAPATTVAPSPTAPLPITVAPAITVATATPPPPLSAAAVATLLSGPTPTAVPLPTRSTEVVVVTRIVEPESSSESASFGVNVRAVPADEEQVGASQHFTFYAEAGAARPPEDVGARTEEILDYVFGRLGAAGDESIDQSMDLSIDVLFRAPPDSACPPRGMALSEPPKELQEAPIIYVFAGDETSRDQVLGVLAHEVAHILHARALEQGLSQNRALNEGFAHWLSADYVYAWYDASSYDALVRGYVDAGNYLSLEHFGRYPIHPGSDVDGGDCLRRRDQLYSEWGSFIGFLIETYGMEPFLELMDSPARERSAEEVTLYPPDYQGVYGLALNQLEVAWLRSFLRD